MKPPVGTDRPFPAYRAFVVQVSATADVTQGHWAGRVEHVISGEATHFQVLDDLLGFIARVLTTRRPQPPETPGEE